MLKPQEPRINNLRRVWDLGLGDRVRDIGLRLGSLQINGEHAELMDLGL